MGSQGPGAVASCGGDGSGRDRRKERAGSSGDGTAVRPPTGPDPDRRAGERPDLAALQRRLADFAAARHWQPYHTPKNLAVALSVEASELLEIFQWMTPEQAAAVMADEGTAHRVRDEVADVMAYLLQFCEVLDIDVLTALAAKIDRNELRFPPPQDGKDFLPG